MGLFGKKYCDICGTKIGLFGNRKLEDGNLCKDCARKLSPLFNERRHSTVEEIKNQLAYREENENLLDDFSPTLVFGESRKLYIDKAAGKFIVTSYSNWKSVNPDLIDFSQVNAVNTDIKENKEEIFYKDSEGNEKSYEPRRYECDYEFNVTILVESPWFDEIELELSDGNRPESPNADLYREYERKMHELVGILMRREDSELVMDGDNDAVNRTEPDNGEHPTAPTAAVQSNDGEEWICQSCGAQNSGKFCENCGTGKPAPKVVRCASCGYTPEDQENPPKFCPECGKQF